MKTWYNRVTGGGAIFDDHENMSNWPDFQEARPNMTPILTVQVRAERDALLASSDHMALADRITDDWRNYRQALRDLPASEGFPNSVAWPTEPA